MLVYRNHDLAKHTTLRVGGVAKMFVVPRNHEELITATTMEDQYFILGGGSNIVFTGFDGVVIYNTVAGYHVDGATIRVESGMMMPALSDLAYGYGLAGLEFMADIPGTVGGGVYMNAGYDADIASAVKSVLFYRDGIAHRLTGQECHFGYRSSIFQKTKGVILEVEFQCQKSSKGHVAARMLKNRQARLKWQPAAPSAGSVFKRAKVGPYFGMSVGGAEFVAPGFVINTGKATVDDVVALIQQIQEKSGASMEVEII